MSDLMDPNENEAGSEPQSGVEASDPNDQLNIMDEDDDDDMDGGVAELEEEDGYNTAEEEEHDHDDTLEPDDSTANGLRFASACVKMEKVWQNKMAPKWQQRWNGDKRKDTLLPRQMIEDFHRDRQTLYPYIRLLLPEQDSYRQFKMKDKYLADAYCNALGFAKGTPNYEMLRHYQDPSKVPKDGIAGDLSLVVEYILQRRSSKQYSSLNIGEMNELLDELADLRGNQSRGRAHHNHGWRESQHKEKKKKTSIAELRAKWLKKVIDKGLSPLEHKWLTRILLKKMEVSAGALSVFKWLSPYAPELWSAHNNLKRVCAILADPEYAIRRKEMELNKGLDSTPWDPQVESAVLGNTLSPMISTRSSFEKLMAQSQRRHETYVKKIYPASAKKYRPLSLRFPALTAEIKLDGERFIVHMKEGHVEMNTRNGKWYSELYGPVLGPALRRALAKYPKVDVILDGEVESWDDTKKSLVPFGENRTVASYRRAYLKHEGLVDPIDTNYHPDRRNDPNVMRTTSQWNKVELNPEEQASRGRRFWLKFMAFDVLYVEGDDARRLLDDCGVSSDVPTGSIINLPLLERKQILYRLLTTQENEVEICPTAVIRCNGECVPGEEYFSTSEPIMEFGHLATQLDSTYATIRGDISGLEEIDELRQEGKKDRSISRMRTRAVEHFYIKVVEEYKFEGLVVKDLASPYRFADRGFWWKFKPDYESEEAEDVDVVILGATFATGIRDGGTPSSYLVGVLDGHDSSRSTYMTLSTLNANSVANDKRGLMWEHTGFKRGGPGEPMELGKWFREDDYNLPDFLSPRSLQRDSVMDYDGWTFSKANTYPNVWIDPADSIVLTIKAQELVLSDEHSCGLSMRFPKIKKVRLATVDGDEKKASEIDTHTALWDRFLEAQSQRGNSDAMASQSQSQYGVDTSQESRKWRFLTPEEYAGKNRTRKRRKVQSPSRKIPKLESGQIESEVLKGLSFIILEGRYVLDTDSLEAQEAKSEGWHKEGLGVKSEQDVMKFVLKHGGTVRASLPCDQTFLVGGSKTDARVVNQIRGLELGRSIKNPKTKSDRELAEYSERFDGILKWTFVFSLVHRYFNSGWKKTDCIRECDDEGFLIPGPQNYLARVEREISVEEEIFCLDGKISEADMQRALVSPGPSCSQSLFAVPWQHHGIELPPDERWILSSVDSCLWPYENDSSNFHETFVVYPDIFAEFGFLAENDAMEEIMLGADKKRWNNALPDMDEVMSVLGLAKMMGAFLTPHLHSGVNTIICTLNLGIEEVQFEQDVTNSDIFEDRVRGQRLLEHLGSLVSREKIRLVSPEWIRNKL